MTLHAPYDPDNIFAKILRGEIPAAKVWEDDHVLARLIEAARRTARAVVKALEPEGFQIMQFNGEAGGQTVFHLHFHIVPRWSDRPMKGHGHAPMAEPETLRALAGRIAAALD